MRDKESVAFVLDPNIQHLPDDVQEVLQRLKETLERHVWEWRTFPIALPNSQEETVSNIDVSHLFVEPNFDELEEVARSSNGQLKPLGIEQLNEVYHKGEFSVPSLHFPGQSHRWALSWLLQKGLDRCRNSLNKRLAFAAKMLLLYARNRLDGKYFSLTHTARSWRKGVAHLVDLLIGVVHEHPDGVTQKVRAERLRYLIAELDTEDTDAACTNVSEMARLVQDWKASKRCLRDMLNDAAYSSCRIVYNFVTPTGIVIDLRLQNIALWHTIRSILQDIFVKAGDDWLVDFKAECIERLCRDGTFDRAMLQKRVQEEVNREYEFRVMELLNSSKELEGLGHGLGRMLQEQFKAACILDHVTERLEEELKAYTDGVNSALIAAHPLKSRVRKWRERQVDSAVCEFWAKNNWAAYERALTAMQENHLEQTQYFLSRDYTFRKEHEPRLQIEYSKTVVPDRTFTFRRRLWSPKNWIVIKHDNGEQTRVPTQLRDSVLDLVGLNYPNDGVRYTLERHDDVKSTTSIPFWRWRNFVCRSYKWISNIFYFMVILQPLYSSFGIRALVWPRRYYPNWAVHPMTGVLHRDKRSMTHSFASRLVSLWSHVRKSRAHFEAQPDRGILGKAITRHFNRAWNYVVKGFLGTVAVLVVQPPVCILATVGSVFLGLLAPLWAPVAALLHYLVCMCIWDFDFPLKKRKSFGRRQVLPVFDAVLFRMVVMGCLQPLAACFYAGIICPLVAGLTCMFFGFGYACRRCWDGLMFNLVLKRLARVPAQNSFLAKRVAGPGMSSQYFYQIKPEQALILLQVYLQREELIRYRSRMEELIAQPSQHYDKFCSDAFNKLGLTVASSLYPSTQFQKKRAALEKQLHAGCAARLKQLDISISSQLRNRVRLTAVDLEKVMQGGTKLASTFYPKHIFAAQEVDPKQFWQEHALKVDDYHSLVEKHFSELFSEGFLFPLEETDRVFSLEVSHMDLSKFTENLVTAVHRDDLDLVRPKTGYLPSTRINVSRPSWQADSLMPDQLPRFARGCGHSGNEQKSQSPWDSYVEHTCPWLSINPVNVMLQVYDREHETHVQVDERDAGHALVYMSAEKSNGRVAPAMGRPRKLSSERPALDIVRSDIVTYSNSSGSESD